MRPAAWLLSTVSRRSWPYPQESGGAGVQELLSRPASDSGEVGGRTARDGARGRTADWVEDDGVHGDALGFLFEGGVNGGGGEAAAPQGGEGGTFGVHEDAWWACG
ncbi:hypothetical protein A4V12_09850 [Streptomyces noursei]|nr:hypothetical protein A4V12_09850 [Streptomyces noursei]